MFGVGFQEMLLVGLLLLMLFGPKRLSQMARDLGRFASRARHVVDQLKTDFMSEVEEDRKPQRSSGTRSDRELEQDQVSTLRS